MSLLALAWARASSSAASAACLAFSVADRQRGTCTSESCGNHTSQPAALLASAMLMQKPMVMTFVKVHTVQIAEGLVLPWYKGAQGKVQGICGGEGGEGGGGGWGEGVHLAGL